MVTHKAHNPRRMATPNRRKENTAPPAQPAPRPGPRQCAAPLLAGTQVVGEGGAQAEEALVVVVVVVEAAGLTQAAVTSAAREGARPSMSRAARRHLPWALCSSGAHGMGARSPHGIRRGHARQHGGGGGEGAPGLAGSPLQSAPVPAPVPAPVALPCPPSTPDGTVPGPGSVMGPPRCCQTRAASPRRRGEQRGEGSPQDPGQLPLQVRGQHWVGESATARGGAGVL
jgi:hypothetical protein